jgi:WD40 repeat protein
MYKIFSIIVLFCLFKQASAQKPVLTIPTGQNLIITAFKITPNGRYLLSASLDRSIKIYDLSVNKEVFTFWEHTTFVSAITIAADNKTVISGDGKGELIFWNLNTGRVIKKERNLHNARVTDLDISTDGRYLLSTNLNGIVRGYDLKADTAMFLSIENTFSINKAHFTNDGKGYLAVSPDTVLQRKKQHNVVLAKYDDNGTLIKGISSTTSLIRSADLSRDNKSIYYVTEQPTQIIKYNIKEDRIVFEQSFPGITPLDIMTIDDRRILILARDWNNTAVLIVYDVETRKKIKSVGTDFYITNDLANYITMQKYPGRADEIAFIPGVGINVYSFNFEKYELQILNKKEAVIQSNPLVIGNDLYLGGDSKVINKWDLSGNFIEVIFKDQVSIHKLIKNREHLLVAGSGKWMVWDTKSNKLIKTVMTPDIDVEKLFISPDQKLIAIVTSARTIDIYNADDYSFIKKLNIGFDFSSFNLSWKNNSVIAIRQPKTARTIFFYDINKGLLAEKIDVMGYMSIFTNIDDRYFVALIRGPFLRIYDSKDNTIKVERIMEANTVFSLLKYDAKLNQLIIGTEDGVISFLNPKTLQTEKTLNGHKSWVAEVAFNENYTKIFSTSHDNTVKVWDLKTFKEISTLSILGVNSWVTLGPNNLFDASPLAMKKLYYVVNDSTDLVDPYKIIGLDQLKHRYYQPGLLQIQMGFNKEPLRVVPTLENIELAPKLKGSLIDNHTLKIDLKNQKGGIGKVSIFINNAEIVADARPNKDRDKNLATLSIAVDLNSYANRFAEEENVEIKIVAWNGGAWLRSMPEIIKYNSLKSKGVTVISNTAKKPVTKSRLFALVIGTSDYSGSQIDLKYAGKDASDFAAALKASSQKLFGIADVEINLLISESTDLSLQPDKKNLIKVMKEMAVKIKPTDILVVYLSGHGVNFGGADGDFYYLTREAVGADAAYLADPAVRSSSAVSSAELTDLLNKISAKKKILILDACASGKAAETMLAGARDVPASQVRALDRMQDRTGFYILSGSAADAVSYESSVYGQGLLTYSLLKAMKGAALRIDGEEEYVDIQKLLQYAVDEVPKLAAGIGGIQKPLYRSPDNQQSFDIGKSDETTKKSIQLAEPKPVFVAVGLQDPIELFDKLNLSEKINAALRENTAKGKNADFVFTEAKDYPGSYRISGTYEQKNEVLTLKYVIIKDKVRVGDVRTFSGSFKDATVFVASFMNELKVNVK